jgi:hypothetical protein
MQETSDLVKRISQELKINPDEVIKQRQIPINDAVVRYLPPYLQEGVINELGVEPKEPLSNALYHIGIRRIASKYEKEFRDSQDGNLWYECNFPRPKIPNLTSAYRKLTRRSKTRPLKI